MKVKLLSTYPKKTLNVDNVFISSDLHLNHQAVINFGRKFKSVEQMNNDIVCEINRKVSENDLLILVGDTMMVDKNYATLLSDLKCNNVILLLGNHCGVGRMTEIFNSKEFNKFLYFGHYLEISVEKQIICLGHHPQFHWNYQDDGSYFLHGHLHSDESDILKEIHKYKSMDVGIDNYKKLKGIYSVFSFGEIQEELKDKLVIARH